MKVEGDSRSIRSCEERLPPETFRKFSLWPLYPGANPTLVTPRWQPSIASLSGANGQEVLQPCLAAKMTILLGAQLIRQAILGQVDVVIRQDGIFADRPLESAALDQSLGQITSRAHLV